MDGSVSSIMRKGSLSNGEVVRFGTQMLFALSATHRLGVLHLDLKPNNLLVKNRSLKVTDFGLAAWQSGGGFGFYRKLYNMAIPPEIAGSLMSGQPNVCDLSFDLYQAGVTLYRMANGDWYLRRLINGLNQSELLEMSLKGKIPSRTVWSPHISKKLKSVIKKAIAKKPEDRFQTASELRNALVMVKSNLSWRLLAQSDDLRVFERTVFDEGKGRFRKFVVQSEESGNNFRVSGFEMKPDKSRRCLKNGKEKCYSSLKEADKAISGLIAANQ